MAAERIKAAITETLAGERPVKAILDAYNPTGSTAFVNFTTSKETRWQTDPRKSHVNWVVCDSDWEAEFCRVAESHPRVRARSEEHTSELQSLMRISYAVFCLKKKNTTQTHITETVQ